MTQLALLPEFQRGDGCCLPGMVFGNRAEHERTTSQAGATLHASIPT